MAIFGIGEYYPHPAHRQRIQRYKENRKLFLGKHDEVFERVQRRLTSAKHRELVYISCNLPGIICKKSADFLFGETPVFSAGKKDNSKEQMAIDRLVQDNELNITNYESALGNSFRGDSFYKIRWGQEYGGMVDKKFDPFRVFIEPQNSEYVFPETVPGDANKILCHHIAYPSMVANSENEWILHVESHYPGFIQYHKYRMNPLTVTVDNEITEWKIYAEIVNAFETVETGVPFPLVVHIPNYSTDESWEGIDDLSEHKSIFDEINNRLAQIAVILDKHADPAVAVPAGSLGEDEAGNPTFRIGLDKVFEVMGKDDVIPQYITWEGQLQNAYTELEKLVEFLLINAELPTVALGKGDSGTSGSSGLSIKWRMNSLLAKINRKRQYYDKGLKKVLHIAQLLESERLGKVDYQITVPKIKFNDGLPKDETEQANIYSIRTGGKATISVKTAMMNMDGLTEEQADAELKRIEEEEAVAEPSIFNQETPKGTPRPKPEEEGDK